MRTPQSQNEQEFEVMEKCIVEEEWGSLCCRLTNENLACHHRLAGVILVSQNH